MLKSIARYSIFGLSMLMLFSCASNQNQKKAELYYGAGTQSLMTKDYTDALTNLDKANKLDPNNSGILNNMAMAYYFKGEKKLAIKTLKKSLELDPKNSDARINLASIHFEDKNYTQAEKMYKQTLRDLTYDKQARTLYNLGSLKMAQKNVVAAENYFKKSVAEDNNYCPSYMQLGLIYLKRNQPKIAHKNFREATMGTCYENPAPHYYQGLTLIQMKRYHDARMKFDEIDVKFKDSTFAAKARARMLELNTIERNNSPAEESHASRNVLESPEF